MSDMEEWEFQQEKAKILAMIEILDTMIPLCEKDYRLLALRKLGFFRFESTNLNMVNYDRMDVYRLKFNVQAIFINVSTLVGHINNQDEDDD